SSNRDDDWEMSEVRDIYAIRPAGQDIRRVSDGTGSWKRPSWSPDGTTIACLGTRNLSSDAARTELFIVPAGGGSPESMSAGFDRSLADQGIGDSTFFAESAPRWAADGKSILTVCSDEGSVQLARVDVPDGGVTLLTSGAHKVSNAAQLPDGRVALGVGTPTTAGDIWIRGADGALSQLTHVGDEWGSSIALSQPEEFRVASADGTMIHGWIMKPANFDPDTKYPMLLEIHGGPFGMYAEALMHEFQTLAARGYVVLYTNPRGSAGYGDEFAGALFRGWGKHDMPDLMAAVDWAIEQGYVDPERLGILGGSYGGFMTNWVIGHTDRFKAAVTQRCLSDMYSTYGTDDIYFAMADQTIGGDPWDDPDIYWELSPITYVENIDTPLLIEHQEQDMRCPIGQAQQLFTALKRRGKTVEMMLYPDESHGMSRTGQPKHRIERLNAMLDWFDRYL
ncbi:MAG: S9 family peptidase, partial [Thermomicrobiales bacterium]|nr:S9 family peptidase [Thermomicrobiales bacterium]